MQSQASLFSRGANILGSDDQDLLHSSQIVRNDTSNESLSMSRVCRHDPEVIESFRTVLLATVPHTEMTRHGRSVANYAEGFGNILRALQMDLIRFWSALFTHGLPWGLRESLASAKEQGRLEAEHLHVQVNH